MGIIDRDMNVLVSGASHIGLISRERMLVEKDSRTNIFSVKDGFRFDPWLDLFKVSPNWPCTVAVISQEGRFNLYDLSTDFLYPNWYFNIYMPDAKSRGKFLVVVQNDERKYNLMVVPENAKDSSIPEESLGRLVFDKWADYADIPVEGSFTPSAAPGNAGRRICATTTVTFDDDDDSYAVAFDGTSVYMRPEDRQVEWKKVWSV